MAASPHFWEARSRGRSSRAGQLLADLLDGGGGSRGSSVQGLGEDELLNLVNELEEVARAGLEVREGHASYYHRLTGQPPPPPLPKHGDGGA